MWSSKLNFLTNLNFIITTVIIICLSKGSYIPTMCSIMPFIHLHQWRRQRWLHIEVFNYGKWFKWSSTSFPWQCLKKWDKVGVHEIAVIWFLKKEFIPTTAVMYAFHYTCTLIHQDKDDMTFKVFYILLVNMTSLHMNYDWEDMG